MKKNLEVVTLIITAFLIGAFVRTTFAGSLTPSSTPASTMYTLESIYSKLTTTNGTTATESAQSFTTPGSVSATFHNLKQIYESIPTLDATKILTGTTYMGVSGTANSGSDYNTFGPYVNNGNGTVTDQNTGLIWQYNDLNTKLCYEYNANAIGNGCTAGSGKVLDINGDGSVVLAAKEYCQHLQNDGVTINQTNQNIWRIPTVNEWKTVLNLSVSFNSPIVGIPNINSGQVNSVDDTYWTSTEYVPSSTFLTWSITTYKFPMNTFKVDNKFSIQNYVRCVR